MTLFASLVFERPPMTWQDLPDGLVDWLQNAGAISAFGILLIIISRLFQRDGEAVLGAPGSLMKTAGQLAWGSRFDAGMQSLAKYLGYIFAVPAVLYTIVIVCWIGNWAGIQGTLRFLPRPTPMIQHTIGDWLLMIGGAISLMIVVMPILIDLVTRISWGRIWAVARLSWKEAIRGRVVWVFGAMALVFLFADWFVSAKSENLLRTYVRVVFWSMTPLFLLTAGILGSFSIPNDVKNNSIHTIVTKPVEKFEIVLGRFLGYGAISTIGLFVVSNLSLIYVARGVNEDAAKESYRARVPIYGALHFAGTKDAQRADSVGREWGYRSYITGPTLRQREAHRQYAIWDLAAIPADLAQRPEPLQFEYAFDIFRLSKGNEGEGVFCTFTFADGAMLPGQLDPQIQEATKERGIRLKPAQKELDGFAAALTEKQGEIAGLTKARETGKLAELLAALTAAKLSQRDDLQKAAVEKFVTDYAKVDRGNADDNNNERARILDELRSSNTVYAVDRTIAQDFGIYQARTLEVTDNHTQSSQIPPGVANILAESAKKKGIEAGAAPVRVFVSVDTAREAQMVGVAQQDFYLLAYEMPFWQNFLKGVVGMWCTHMLVLGVALSLSTYLSAVISFLATMFLFLVGLFVDYLKEIAEHRVDGGGPAESLIRIGTHMPVAGKLDDSPTKTLVNVVDAAFSWWIGRIMNLIPNVNRHDLVQYVANGFDISFVDVLLLDNIIPLAAYLIPWAILAYYLMKYREIANPS